MPLKGQAVLPKTENTDSDESSDKNGSDGTDGSNPESGNDSKANPGSDGIGSSDGGGGSSGDLSDGTSGSDPTEEPAGDNGNGSDESDGSDSSNDNDGANQTDPPHDSDESGDRDGPDGSDADDANNSPDNDTSLDGSDSSDGSDASNGFDSTDGSDGTDSSDSNDERDGSDDADINEGDGGSDEANIGAVTQMIRAADGEIVIDLASSAAQSGTIDLALLTTSEPAGGPISYEIVARPRQGSARLDGSLMTYTPSPNAENDLVEYVAVQGSVRSSAAKVRVRVLRGALGDDPKLIDSTRAQLEAAAAAGFVQLDAIAGHLETGSWDDRCLVQNRAALRSAHVASAESAEASEGKTKATSQCRESAPVRVWVSGVVTIDDQQGRISTDGVTAGIEATPTANSIAGLAVGVSQSEYGATEASSFEMSSLSLAAYSAWRPAHGVHLSGVFGYAGINVDARRQLGLGEEFGRMTRSGHLWFAMLRAAAEFEIRDVNLTSYARAGLVKVRLGKGQENVSHPLGLSMGEVAQTQFESTLGAMLLRPFRLAHGSLAPFARAEHRWRSASEFVQPISHLSELSQQDLVRGENGSNGSWVFGTGAHYQVGRVRLAGEYTLFAEPNLAFGNGIFRLEFSAGF